MQVLREQDIVLEIGSGSSPWARSDVLLDRYYIDETGQRGGGDIFIDRRPMVVAAGERLPFKDKAFDFVYCCHVIEHATDIVSMLDEMSRVAKAGFIECPNPLLERSRDIIWALTSGRSERLEELGSSFFDFIPNENVAINFEMELFDATINLGIIGFFLVCGFFWFAINKSFFGALPLALTGLVILIIILSGHFFNAIAIAPYVAVYFRLLDELRFVRTPPIKMQFVTCRVSSDQSQLKTLTSVDKSF